MKSKSKICLCSLAFVFIFFSFTTFAGAAANVSRTPGVDSWAPRIAVDSAGNLHVVWAEYYSSTSGDAFYSKYDISTQEWSVPLNLSNSSLVHSEEYRPVGIDIESSDRIYVVYAERNLIKMRTFSGGSWDSPFEVASNSANCDSARIAVDSSGNIFICWWLLGPDVGTVCSRARIGGSWESVRVISSGGRRSKFPDIAVGDNEVFAAWVQRDPTDYFCYYVRRSKSFNASWSSPQLVAQSSHGHEFPAVEIDSNNIVHMIWMTVINPSAYERVTHYAYWTGSGFSSPQTISSQLLLHYPSLYERGNNLYATWQYGAWGYGVAVLYNTRINGIWTGQGSVPESGECTYCDVSTSPSQHQIYFVWDARGEIWCNMGSTGPPPPPSGNPVADFVFSPTSGAVPLTVSFDASASYDPDGSIVSYSWNFGDGTAGSGRVTSHTYNAAGTFFITLRVTDNEGKTGSSTKSITVVKVNDPPIAEFSFSPTTGIFPLQVTFDASASRDPDGSIVQYSWDFGDGSRGSGRVVTHDYNKWGTFSVGLTVRDDRNATASKIRTIEVLRLFQPLNIRWETHVDESLFMTRYVTEVRWDRNPENDRIGAQIVLYRIYRKKTADSYNTYVPIAEVTGETYRYLDKKAGGKNLHAYTVTAIDSQGHESPIIEGSLSQQMDIKESKNPGRNRSIIKRF